MTNKIVLTARIGASTIRTIVSEISMSVNFKGVS